MTQNLSSIAVTSPHPNAADSENVPSALNVSSARDDLAMSSSDAKPSAAKSPLDADLAAKMGDASLNPTTAAPASASKKERKSRRKKKRRRSHSVSSRSDLDSDSVSPSRSRSRSRKSKKKRKRKRRKRSSSYSSDDSRSKRRRKSRRDRHRRSDRRRSVSRSYSSRSRSYSSDSREALSPRQRPRGYGAAPYNGRGGVRSDSSYGGHRGGGRYRGGYRGGGGYRGRGRRGGGGYGPRGSGRWTRDERENPKSSRVLGCFGLSQRTDDKELERLFTRYGAVEKVMLIIDRKTGISKGFAFVYFEREEDAKTAKEETTGIELDGRPIRVDFSLTKRPHSPTPGTYLGRRSYADDEPFGGGRRRGGRGRGGGGYGGGYGGGGSRGYGAGRGGYGGYGARGRGRRYDSRSRSRSVSGSRSLSRSYSRSRTPSR